MKKSLTLTIILLAFLLAVTGCIDPVSSGKEGAVSSTEDASLKMGIPISLPAASVAVENREYTNENFTFETVVEVRLIADIKLYPALTETGEAVPLEPEEVEKESGRTLVTAYNERGKVVFRTTVGGLETLNRLITVPTDEGALQFEFERPGYESQTVVIQEAPRKERIELTVPLKRFASGPVAPSADVSPTQTYNVPAESPFTVAYEDYFPNVGDADFNDFVVQYDVSVVEEDGFVTDYTVDATARARAAGFDHEFGFVLNFPGFIGSYEYWYEEMVDGAPVRREFSGSELDSVRIVLFPSTKGAFDRGGGGVRVDNGYLGEPLSEGLSAGFTISFAAYTFPVSADDVDVPPFDPYLFVHNTGYDVHLMNRPALEGSKNFEVPIEEWENFIDQAGYPRALLVPTAWPHPLEVTKIDNAYPDFTVWRESNGDSGADWYNYPTSGLVFDWTQ